MRNLQELVPLSIPVTVRVANCPQKPEKTSAMTTFDGARIHIRIHPQQSFCSAIDSLIHEWAHARVMCMGFEHKDVWGQEYAKAYEADEPLRG